MAPTGMRRPASRPDRILEALVVAEAGEPADRGGDERHLPTETSVRVCEKVEAGSALRRIVVVGDEHHPPRAAHTASLETFRMLRVGSSRARSARSHRVRLLGPEGSPSGRIAPEVQISAVVDQDLDRARSLQPQFPLAQPAGSLEEALAAAEFDGVIVATNPASHFEVTSAALAAGKHVLVEKPLALTSKDCIELGRLAREAAVKLMVGHTFRFSPAVQHVKGILDGSELGEVYYVDSQRLNLGRVRSDVDSMWNFAPHDISILNYWLGPARPAFAVTPGTTSKAGIADVAFLVLEYPQSVLAHVHVSWLSPSKVRRLTIVGSERMVVYDDVASEKVVIFDSGIDREHLDRAFPEFESYGEFQLIQREGDIHLPRIPNVEPLVAEARHFVECIADGEQPVVGAEEGEAVVRVLEAATKSLEAGGERFMSDSSIPLVDLKAQFAAIEVEVRAASSACWKARVHQRVLRRPRSSRSSRPFSGVEHAVALANGTVAIELALEALEVGAGDEVVTVSHTFFATTEAVAAGELRRCTST